MNRVSFALLVVAAVSLAGTRARAELPVAPPPREVRSDGSRDPAPQSEPPVKGENPAVTVERIIKNSKDVGDKLAQTDTGTDTRKTQGKILSDIDALINQQENPPPPQPDKDKDKNKDQDKDKEKKDKDEKDKKDPMMNPDMGPKKDMPMDGMGMDMMPPPKDGTGERQPRKGDPMNDAKKEPGGNDAKQPGKGDPKKAGEKSEPKDNTGGMTPGNPMGKANGKTALPVEEDVSKDVWGHLPDKLRQQMSQYYKEDFTPKYAELLRLYYSSLAEKGQKK